MNRFLWNNLWSILWGLVILVLLLMPGGLLPKVPSWVDSLHPDKLVHLFIFGIFAFLLIHGFKKPGSPPAVIRYAMLIAFFISIFTGGATELIQGWCIPFRTAEWGDFFADAVGTLAGVGISKWELGIGS